MLDTHNKHANISHTKIGELLLLADTLLFKIFLDICLCVVYNIDMGYIPYCKRRVKACLMLNTMRKRTAHKQGAIDMSKNFRETLNSRLETDSEFRKEYEALAPEYELAKMLIACRNADNLTQKQLSELTGIDQADISKIENGNANPSIKTLTRIASAMNMNLKIEFVPKTQNV